MENNDILRPIQSREREAHRLRLFSGTMYGLVFGLSFAAITWGYDGYVLASNRAAYAWTKLALGLPLTLIIGGLTGRLAAMSPSAVLPVALWTVTGGLLGVIASHIPFEGRNLAVWIADKRLWGEVVFPFGRAASVRMTLVMLTNIALGAGVGLGQNLAVQWAWNRATSEAKMSPVSWLGLLVCIPLAMGQAATINEFFNEPLRLPQRSVGELVGLAAAGDIETAQASGMAYTAVRPFVEAMSAEYVNHFVTFGSETDTWYSAYVDIAFDNGFVLRCATSGKNVVYCDDFSAKFAGWMGDLVHAGLTDERPWLEGRIRRLDVDDAVVAWLRAHSSRLSENYEVSRAGQQWGWVFMAARFDTGFEMVCRFEGATPVLVDQCVEAQARD